jgi:hypothetical protein
MRVDGEKIKVKFTKKDPEAVVAVQTANHIQISMAKVSGKDPRKGIRTQQFTVNLLMPTASLEDLVLPAVFDPVDGGVYSDQFLKGLPPTGTLGLWGIDAGGTLSLTITGRAGNRITGTFSGTLNKTAGDGPGTVNITSGKFTVTIQQ